MPKKRSSMGTIYPKRIRDTIAGETVKVQTGYLPKRIDREEGEIWEDKYGKQWTKKEGIIKSIPKFSDVRIPMFCPKCNGVMGKKSKDTEVFYKFGFCLDCLIDRDVQLIRDGKMDEYAKKYVNDKKLGYYTDMKLQIEDYLETIKDGKIEYPNAEGKMEEWSGDVTKLKKFWQDELDNVNKELEQLKMKEN